jgi:hypothetical protein
MVCWRSTFVALAVVAVTGCATSQHPWSDQELCTVRMAPDSNLDRHETWIELLVSGYDRKTRRTTEPAVDCSGAQVKWEAPALACSDNTTTRTLLPDRPLTEEDVIVQNFGPDFRLVWVITNHFSTGDGLGPVAVVEVTPRYLIVRAIGSLRAHTRRVKLRLEKLGTTEVIVAEGDHCTTKDAASCIRAARVMPFKNGRFAPERIVNPNGLCVQPAWFYLVREETSRLETGWQRIFRLTATFGFDPQSFSVQEELTVHDRDPKAPPSNAQLLRKAQSSQTVKYINGQLVSDQQSLWTKMKAIRAGD